MCVAKVAIVLPELHLLKLGTQSCCIHFGIIQMQPLVNVERLSLYEIDDDGQLLDFFVTQLVGDPVLKFVLHYLHTILSDLEKFPANALEKVCLIV